MVQAWIVRAGRDDEYEHEALEQGLIAMGWRRLGDLAKHSSLAAIKKAVDDEYVEYSARSRQVYSVQMYAFRCRMRTGDLVVLLRSNAPDVAVGVVTGDYSYRPELLARHTRAINWGRTDVRRTEIGADILTAPALTNIYKIGRQDAEARLKVVIEAGGEAQSTEPSDAFSGSQGPSIGSPSDQASAMEYFRRNLHYALSLATAGLHLQKLKVEAFEVSDVYRAAWVQAVAALDHWVHQEIHDRMLALAEQPTSTKTKQFQNFQLPIALVEKVVANQLTMRQAVDAHWSAAFGGVTFQQPNKIQNGLSHIADVSNLWPRVATVLTERANEGVSYNSDQVQSRLREVVFRRNKIAHEYDQDPTDPLAKRPIDAASTTQTIEWIGQLAEAIVVVLDGPP